MTTLIHKNCPRCGTLQSFIEEKPQRICGTCLSRPAGLRLIASRRPTEEGANLLRRKADELEAHIRAEGEEPTLPENLAPAWFPRCDTRIQSWRA